MKIFSKIFTACALILAMNGGLFISYKSVSASSPVNLATFSFSKSDGASTANDLNDTYGTNADSGYAPSSGKFTTSRLFASLLNPSDKSYKKLEWTGKQSYSVNGRMDYMPVMEASIKNRWGKTPYFHIRTSTKGYEKITLSFLLGGSKKGPKNFALQYSTDGTNYKDISNSSMTLSTNKKMYPFSFTLPDAASNNSIFHVRIIATSTDTIEGGSFTTTTANGESAINDIVIKGTEIVSATPAATQNPVQKTESSVTSSPLKVLSAPSLTSYKSGTKKITGKTLGSAKVTVKFAGKTYSKTASKNGVFKIKLSKKLKKGKKITVSATKSGYKDSSKKKYTVK